MPDLFSCQQCGSTAFEDLSTNQIECSHCGSRYQKSNQNPAVIIEKGATVQIGKSANVVIRGDLEIQEGANLDIQGQVVIDDESESDQK